MNFIKEFKAQVLPTAHPHPSHKMVGLSILLEAQKCNIHNHKKTLHKVTFLKLKPLIPSLDVKVEVEQQQPIFLQHCFLCHQKLLPGKDIYMYKGDRGFCSVECRCRQILLDEEESFKVVREREETTSTVHFLLPKGVQEKIHQINLSTDPYH